MATTPSHDQRRPETPRGTYGALMVALTGAALAVALYLTWTKLQGEAPACAVIQGCEAVEKSEYSAFLGIPVAAFGSLGVALMLAGAGVWWRRADPRGLYAVYGLGLISLVVLGYLAYLELAVIHAVCVWCVTFTVLVALAWLLATYLLYRRSHPS